MKTKTISCALPGQMTLEEITTPTMQRRQNAKTMAQKALLKVNEKNCRKALAEKFGVELDCVAIVAFCWCDGMLCIRAYIERVEYLVQYKDGFVDPAPKVFKVTD